MNAVSVWYPTSSATRANGALLRRRRFAASSMRHWVRYCIGEWAAKELARVCRPGGKVGLANWTPDGFIGQVFKMLGRYLPPPAGVQPPSKWGVESNLQTLFGEDAASIAVTPRIFNFRYRSAAHFVEVFRTWYGPIHKAFAALPADGALALERDLLDLLNRTNRAGTASLVVPSEYLEVVVTRRWGGSHAETAGTAMMDARLPSRIQRYGWNLAARDCPRG
jgi:hypothetical protein